SVLGLTVSATLVACTPPGQDDGDGSATLGSSDATTSGPDDGSTSVATTEIGDADGSGSDDGVDTTAGSTTDDATTGDPVTCEPVPSCDALPPSAGPTLEWESFESSVVSNSGSPRHRGRDMFYNPG